MPSGPISVTTIGAGPAPEYHDATLVLEIPLTSYDGPIDPELATMLQHTLRDWRDGRYPFEVEQITVGLYDCLKRAAQEVVNQKMMDKHGRELVEREDGSGSTAKWYLEAQKVKPVIPHMREEITVRITE